MEENTLDIVELKNQVNKQLGDAETFKALLATTFNGLEASVAKRAFLEGRMRGFTLEDFLKKNIYAIPFKGGYSLVTSIDYARKIGMRSGVVGKSAPVFTFKEGGKPMSCTITIKRMVNEYVGEYTDTVFFDEYTTGRNLWVSKPLTMFAKVAEMHALRMACPEELSQAYAEEEYQKETLHETVVDITDYSTREAELRDVKTLAGLTAFWKTTTAAEKIALKEAKDEMKAILDTEANKTDHENA